ncbi:hypothetical protein FKP32DRAFT_1679795 [Trametes sanguinea]|nr:hypothetical protein FKP32DRAFT_1679795 [Trametes sanguinea]
MSAVLLTIVNEGVPRAMKLQSLLATDAARRLAKSLVHADTKRAEEEAGALLLQCRDELSRMDDMRYQQLLACPEFKRNHADMLDDTAVEEEAGSSRKVSHRYVVTSEMLKSSVDVAQQCADREARLGTAIQTLAPEHEDNAKVVNALQEQLSSAQEHRTKALQRVDKLRVRVNDLKKQRLALSQTVEQGEASGNA